MNSFCSFYHFNSQEPSEADRDPQVIKMEEHANRLECASASTENNRTPNVSPARTAVFKEKSVPFVDEDCYDNASESKTRPRAKGTPWSKEEDERLVEIATKHKNKSWQHVADELHELFEDGVYRTSNQCNQRYARVLKPSIVKGKWSEREDFRLLNCLKVTPAKKWQQIAMSMDGRTDIQVRYRVQMIRHWLVDHGAPAEYLE
ncbi:Myb-like_DNA-binding domain-containing protein [Hexamita inflata]|uniref:Myb-like DNA-binding domain-containing protein n=1 Tax=Hexamita inflata TaxID=28002 RepID=A0AA86NTA1_9EUKA|nr:Myb-like DNA-binding domain-containing protein [Hexamita inflata]CAI9925289.1 Myb-like DNA-binding domain-containing protein [Hexamita inflata]